ncbi:MAG: polyisoprenoid-binding protein [Micavibrio sp. TMED27]|nr:polyisoprenoid-binding protein [Micavibrio sp.]OUT91583.1 MAG: polyisoprenoid-binding protein [Micavibrio sp. TMED27]|tara:strand:- start:7 stop:591 length:585 start_codon:yes stop_codon:yes gene_type:complete
MLHTTKNTARILLASAALTSFALPALAADTYTLDPMHTAVTWHLNHFGFSNPSGKFMNADGVVVLDQENPAASKVNITIPVAAIDSGVPKLDEHLKSKDFFDVEAFPTASFVSTKVEVTGENTAIVHGNLTLHGVTKPVDLDVKLNKLGENMMNKETAGFSATAMIKRSDFGIVMYLPALSDDVRLDIEVEANK